MTGVDEFSRNTCIVTAGDRSECAQAGLTQRRNTQTGACCKPLSPDMNKTELKTELNTSNRT